MGPCSKCAEWGRYCICPPVAEPPTPENKPCGHGHFGPCGPGCACSCWENAKPVPPPTPSEAVRMHRFPPRTPPTKWHECRGDSCADWEHADFVPLSSLQAAERANATLERRAEEAEGLLEKWWDGKEFAELAALRGQVRGLREALDRIASWEEGPVVGGHFDEPGSAEIARAALAATTGEQP